MAAILLLLPLIPDAVRLEFGLRQGARSQHLDIDAHLATGTDFTGDKGRQPLGTLKVGMLYPYRHDIEPIGGGGQHDLEFVAGPGDRTNALMRLFPVDAGREAERGLMGAADCRNEAVSPCRCDQRDAHGHAVAGKESVGYRRSTEVEQVDEIGVKSVVVVSRDRFFLDLPNRIGGPGSRHH